MKAINFIFLGLLSFAAISCDKRQIEIPAMLDDVAKAISTPDKQLLLDNLSTDAADYATFSQSSFDFTTINDGSYQYAFENYSIPESGEEIDVTADCNWSYLSTPDTGSASFIVVNEGSTINADWKLLELRLPPSGSAIVQAISLKNGAKLPGFIKFDK